MFVLRMRRAEAEASTSLDGLSHLLENLGSDYVTVVASALRFQAELAGLNPGLITPAATSEVVYGRDSVIFSEVVASPSGLVVVQVEKQDSAMYITFNDEPQTKPGAQRIMLYGIGEAEVERDLDTVAAVLGERFNVEFESYSYRERGFKKLKSDGMSSPPPPSSEEIAGARLLADAGTRRAALGIASSGGLLVVDLSKQLADEDQSRAAQISEELQSLGLVATELVVICRRNSAQVARVPTQEALAVMAEQGLKCACGRDVLEERVEQSLSTTELGRRLLAGSWWMTVLLMEELRDLGVDLESLLVEQTSGGDEMDCFADISGELCLFELKDKEFSLGSAYSFGAKIGIHRPAHAIVATTAYVGNDAKEHFRKAQGGESADPLGRAREATKIKYIEGIDSLRDDLRTLVEEIYLNDANSVLRKALPHASMDPASVTRAIVERAQVRRTDAELVTGSSDALDESGA